MNRKDDHLKYALKQKTYDNDFDKIRFVHNALPSISFYEVFLKTSFCGFNLRFPIYINAMTGGSDQAYIINDKLSKLANYFNIPMASGSVSTAIKDSSLIDTFKVIRQNHPNGIVIANIGADKTYEDALKAIAILNADMLQIHLNVVQEMVMPEGDRDFRNLENNIKEIIEKVNVPVIIKEVGFGMSFNTIQKLKELNVKTVDVSGRGGTNFAEIENARREEEFSSLNSFGLSTVESLLEASLINDMEILASGGIRNPMDVVKALALGAKAVGMSKYFLDLVTNNTQAEAIYKFEKFLLEVKTIMTILGIKKVEDLKGAELIFDESILSFMKQRNIIKPN